MRSEGRRLELLWCVVVLEALKLAFECEDGIVVELDRLVDKIEASRVEDVGVGAGVRVMPKPEAMKTPIPIDEDGVLLFERSAPCDEGPVLPDAMLNEEVVIDEVL